MGREGHFSMIHLPCLSQRKGGEVEERRSKKKMRGGGI